MAEENPIRKEDIIDIDGTTTGLKELIKLFNVILSLMDQVKEQGKTMLVPMQNMNPASKEDQVRIAQTGEEVKKLKEEYSQLEKLQKRLIDLRKNEALGMEELRQAIQRQNKDNKDFVASQNAAEGSLTKLRLRLSQLKKEYADASPDKRGGIVDGLKKLDKQVKDLEAEIGVHTRSVGDYKNSILEAAKKIPILGSVITNITNNYDSSTQAVKENTQATEKMSSSAKITGLAIGGITAAAAGTVIALKKMKEAFQETIAGADIMNVVKEASRQMWHDIVTTGQVNYTNIRNAAEAAQVLNKIRFGDRNDLIDFANAERKIAEYEFEAANKTRSHAEQREYLNKAIQRQNKLSDDRIADAQEELDAVNKLLTKMPDNEVLLNRQVALKEKIINLDKERFEQTKRNESRMTNFDQQELDRQQKQRDDLMKYVDEYNKEQEDKRQEQIKADKKAAEEWRDIIISVNNDVVDVREQMRKAAVDAQNEFEKMADDQYKETKVNEDQILRDTLDRTTEETEAKTKAGEDEKEAHQKKTEDMLQIASDATNVFSNILERRKQKELSAAGDNAKEREKIEKKYAQKEQTIAIAQAVINGAQAITKTFAELGWPAGILGAAVTAAITATQIGVIAAQKFAEGGEIDGKPHSQGGTVIEAEKGEYVVKKESYSKYRDLVHAINQDNPMQIAEELRNRQFHTVWGGVQQSLSEVSKQDIYTKKMYELMLNNITTYQDSDGNTVLIMPNKTKRVIKKK